jgi:dienelactone hydrolase
MTLFTGYRSGLTLFALLAAAGTGVQLPAQPPAVPSADALIKQEAQAAPLALKFQGHSAEDCRAWQKQFAAKLRSLLGPHLPPKTWKVIVERTVKLKDHTRQELVLTAPGHPHLPVYLLLPHGKPDQRWPGILALHGHGAHGYDPVAGRDDLPGVAQAIAASNYDYGRQLVQRGYAVAVPCLTPFGRRLGEVKNYGKQDPCAITFVRLMLLGKVLIAENLRDCLWCVEFLAGHPQVDADRLGCVGLSYGGRMTMLTTALEPRLKVAVISGALNLMQERIEGPYSCGAQVIPGLLQYGDVPEIASLIAPRPCLWEVGAKDSLAKPLQVKDALDRLGKAYQSLDAAKQLQVDHFDGGHSWHGEKAYPLLAQILQSK